jgi:uncharacterized protein YdeI (YjbR/CyaY-like superfamily)
MEPIFFATPADWRAWLEEHHDTERELLVGFRKRGSGRASITWPESVDEALCFGWIDGVRRRLDDDSYTIRFTPRRARSTWSAVNVARVKELEAEGRMHPAGLAAFARRSDDRTAIYSYEQRRTAELGEAYEAELRADPAAWAYFAAQPPSYRRAAAHWVTSAKREETRRRRLAQLVADSAQGRPIGPLTRPPR